jgi:predicted transcriptional regulator
MAAHREKRFLVILDDAHRRRLDELAAEQRKSRSAVVRDAIDRMAAPVPDATAAGDEDD